MFKFYFICFLVFTIFSFAFLASKNEVGDLHKKIYREIAAGYVLGFILTFLVFVIIETGKLLLEAFG